MKFCLPLLLIPFMGCIGLQGTLNEMDNGDFLILKQEVYLITKIGFRQAFKHNPNLRNKMTEAVAHVAPYVNEDPQKVMELFTKFKENFLDKIQDPDMRDAVELILLEINKYGGFTYIQTNMGNMLSVRSVMILQSAIKGIVDAIAVG